MTTIEIYMDDGRVFYYEVYDPNKAREHAYAIIKTGYRHTPNETNDLEWYPPTRILKIKIKGAGESTGYHDQTRPT